MPPLPSCKILLSSGWTPLRRPSVRLTLFPAVWLGLALALAGCSGQGRNSNEQRANYHRAVTLNGTRETKPAPSPKFKQLSLGEVGRSLRRITVRVSKFISFNLGDPTPFHTEAQIDWAKKVIAERLPHLKPDQRLQLHYQDQFHKYAVEVEIWAEGNQLVYYFTKLAAKDDDPNRDISEERPQSWVTLVEQPGQSVSYDDRADILKDQLFGAGDMPVGAREEKQDAIQKALASQIIDAEESRKLSRLVETAPRITLADFKTYLDKRETLKQSLLKNIITREEFETLRDRLKKSMTK